MLSKLSPTRLLSSSLTEAPAAEGNEGTLQEAIDRATRARIVAAFSTHGGRRAEAADALGVERTTLYRLMKRLGLGG